MQARKFTGLSNAALHEDGRSFQVDFESPEGALTMEAQVSDIGKLMHLLGKVSLASGDILQVPKHFSPDEGTLSVRPIAASAMAVMKGDAGQAIVMLRVGATTMCFSMDGAVLKGFADDLQRVAPQFDAAPRPSRNS